MKVLLVNPAPNRRTWASYSFLHLGLAYLAAYLVECGHEVKVLDMTVRPMSDAELRHCLKKEHAQLVGVTATTPVIKSAWKVCQAAKEETGAWTVIGGAHVSAMPEESAELDFVDVVVTHEGEVTLVELCETLGLGGSLMAVKGIAFKGPEGVVRTAERGLIEDLNELPFPARQLFPPLSAYSPSQPYLSRRKPSVNILTSRGCPYSCFFCYKGVFGHRYRMRSVENVVAEWRSLVQDYRVKEIEVVDDNFALDVDRAVEICDRIVAEKLVIPWATFSGIRVDHPDHVRLLKAMKRAGCYRLAMGIESGSDDVLEKIGKKITTARAREAVKVAQSLGFEIMGLFMIGNVGETAESIQRTIDFARELNTDYAQFLIATPFPGSPMYAAVEKEGKFLVRDWDEYDNMGGQAFFEMGDITRELAEGMRQKAYRSFYLRPVFVRGRLKHVVKHPGDLLTLGRGVWKWARL